MALGTLSVCLSAIVLNLHHKGGTRRVPRWARIFFIQYCGHLFGFNFKRICRTKKREYSGSYKESNHTHMDADSTEMMEIQNILPQRETNLNRYHNHNHDNYIINETLNYHNVNAAHIRHRDLTKEPSVAESKEDAAEEWQMLAKVLDSIFFTIVFFTMTGSACGILLSPWYIDGGPKT